MVENGPLPPQKHHEAGSLLNPMAVLFPSLQIGGKVGDGEEILDMNDVCETELVDAALPEPIEDTGMLDEVCETLELLGPEGEAVTGGTLKLLALEPGDGDIDNTVVPSSTSYQNANGIVVPSTTVVGSASIAAALILEISAPAETGQASTTVVETVVVISHPDVVIV
jgi:hypothetical protein